jgi:hypothetical protein
VALFAADIGDQAHAAGIVLIARMIEALRLRSAETTVGEFHGSPYEQDFGCGMPNTQLLCDFSCENRPALSRELCVSRSGRIRMLRCF